MAKRGRIAMNRKEIGGLSGVCLVGCVLLAVGGSACSGGESGGPLDSLGEMAGADGTGGGDVQGDAVLDTVEVAPDQGGEDMAADLEPEDPCLLALAEGAAFELFPDGPDTQIHAAAAYDGEAVWVAFNAPSEGTSFFGVFVTRLACDGSVLVPPTEISNPEAGNQVDPAIAVSGSKVMVAWQADSGVFPNNMDIPYRVFGREGDDLLDVYGLVEPVITGTADPGTIWMPRAVGMGDGSFALVGSLARDGFNVFQTVLQRIDGDGLLTGGALHLVPDNSAGQVYPAIARASDSELILLWSHEPAEADAKAVYGLLGGDDQALAAVNDANPDGPSTAGDVAANPVTGAAFVTYTTQSGSTSDVWLRSIVEPAQAKRSFCTAGKSCHTGALALRGEGGVIAWYRNISGLSNDMLAQPFVFAQGMFMVDDAFRQVNELPVAPYAIGMTHVAGPYYFFTWSQGANPKYRVVGKFMKLGK